MKHRESDIQESFFKLINLSPLKGYVWATPNGGNRPKRQNKKGEWYSPAGFDMKKQGQMAGVWDVFVAIPRMEAPVEVGAWPQFCGGLFIEFKTPPEKSAEKRLTESQVEFRERLRLVYAFQIHTDPVKAFDAVKRYAGYEK